MDQIYIALRLDPLSPIVNTNVGLRLAELGRFEEAVEQFRKLMTLEPGFAVAHVHLGMTYLAMSEYDEGIAQLNKAVEPLGGNPWPKATLGYAYALKGDPITAQSQLRELEDPSKTGFAPDALLATAYFALGQKEKEFSLFQKAYDERSNALQFIMNFPLYREIRADPRFKAILAKIAPTTQGFIIADSSAATTYHHNLLETAVGADSVQSIPRLSSNPRPSARSLASGLAGKKRLGFEEVYLWALSKREATSSQLTTFHQASTYLARSLT